MKITNSSTLQDASDKEGDLVLMLAKQVTLSPLPVVLSMSAIAVMAAGSIPTFLWVAWLAAAFSLQALRWVVYRNLPSLTSISIRNRLNIAVAINIANSLVHSISLLFFPVFSPFERAVQSMLFVGMGVASVTTTAGYLPFALTHIVLGLLPMYALWGWSATLPGGGWIEILIPITGIFYSFTLYIISRNIYELYNQVYDQRHALQDALSQAEMAGRAKTRFLASASHDLRQPIHSLSLFSASLAQRDLDQKSMDIVEHIGHAIRALTLQMDSLLDISKLDADVVPVASETILLARLLQRLSNEYQHSAVEKQLVLEFECPDDACVRTDPVLLERIIGNLMGNAIKYCDSGAVTLTAVAKGDNWILRVHDTGVGIAKEEQEHIFEEFYQIDNEERDREKGLGLGLAIVRRLVNLLSLQLELESELGSGSTFTLQLPGERRTKVRDKKELPGDVILTSLKVLVVDDEAEIRFGMRAILESWGCEVLLAEGGETAIDAVQLTQPAIALVDFRLRGNDNGIYVIQSLRRLYPDLPALLISGDTAPDRLRYAGEAGITLIHKPVLPDVLLQSIVSVLHPKYP